jgi:UDP-2-acetamido-3-amino-2,3-dideoxy-glucuronate N-acetyltransferase
MISKFYSHSSAVIEKKSKIGKGTNIWHFSHIMSNSEIGENCNIGQNVVISPKVKIGSNCKIQNNVSVYTGIICEDDVFLGPSVVFTNIKNPRSSIIRRDKYVKTIVSKGATIGANATIICGNNIGEYAFVGAGAVVTKFVSPYSIVVGNPAKKIGWISRYGHRLDFKSNKIAKCPESEDYYELNNGKVSFLGKK